MSSESQHQFVTCRCQHCDGHIEFDASEYSEGEDCVVACPHCQKEFVVTISSAQMTEKPQSEPLPPVLPPPSPIDPISATAKMPTLEIRLTSGVSFDVVAIRLYDETKIEDLKTKSSKAIQILEEAAHADSLEAKKELRKLSSRGIAVQQNVRPWDVAPTGAAAIIGFLEPFTAQNSFKTAMQLLKEVKEDERNLYKTGSLFHVSRIENLQQAVPGYWRAVFNSTAYIHDGLDFVTVRDGKENEFSLCWNAVEYFHMSH